MSPPIDPTQPPDPTPPASAGTETGAVADAVASTPVLSTPVPSIAEPAMPPPPRTSPWFAKLIDDTSMYPPAGLDLGSAYAEHVAHEGARHAWMLGPLVVSSTRVAEFVRLGGGSPGHTGVLLDGPAVAINAGKRWADGLHLDCRHLAAVVPSHALVQIEVSVPNDANWDTIEIAIEPLCGAGMRVFFEVSPGPGLTDRLGRVAALNRKLAGRGASLGAKLRMGGATAAHVPVPAVVAGFLVACAALELRVKATAGLHQPFRTTPSPAEHAQHGFVNLLAAAARAAAGRKLGDVTAMLEITGIDRFTFADETLRLDGIPVGDAATTRNLLWSIGCSVFDDPVSALVARGWID